ncbi:hypothetical protein A3A66_01915 [Microgenomates group bacterium RIFCSPLOWO2_01_FULL_46_13]|nr:MAG: hypothetical protein A3A66_01915 [Microgenomates group bacterium RIFCSPLOWO2_01_FULL_46_13]
MIKKIKNPLISYENKWIALSSDKKRVIASGKTIETVEKKLAKAKNSEAILMKVLPFETVYSP